ncbi:MAG: hypothetical protein CMH57_04595 [Myxococcales bacterium]|nr:hypothetical protein [Myxococcales bacterium]
MPVTYLKTVAILPPHVEQEEAEALLQWLEEGGRRKINLKECERVHGAVLQVLMAKRPTISVEPSDEEVRAWLMPAIQGAAG